MHQYIPSFTVILSSTHAQIIVACVQCNQPIYEHGDFSGRYIVISKESTVHEECREDYMEQQAEKCVDCGKGIRPCDGFSGVYYGKSDGVIVVPPLHI